MAQLDYLLELEKNLNLMDKLNKQLHELQNGIKIKASEVKYKQLLNKLNKMEEALNSGKTKLRESDYTLKEYELKLKDLDKELYSGTITNEKQLTHLTSERDRINESLEELETEILQNMETISSVENEINSVKDMVSEFKDQIELNKKEVKENIRKLERAKIQLKDNITNVLKTIDDDLIENYKKIRGNKGSALAQVGDGICSGCNIKVPSYQVEDIKKNKIVHCESCNRILYIPEIDIEK